MAGFFLITPFIIGYSLGYRVDFEHLKIVATGGIYVRTWPEADIVTIDSKLQQKPAFFTGSVFVQNLLPKHHSILIKKAGYFDYQKTLPVFENQVTKLENVLLIKNDLALNALAEKVDYFSITPDSKSILLESAGKKSLDFQYFQLAKPDSKKTFSLNLQNAKISEIQWTPDSKKAIIKIQKQNGVSYYAFDTSKTSQPVSAASPSDGKNLSPKNPLPSPDNKNLLYLDGKEIYVAAAADQQNQQNLLYTAKDKISSCFWMNNDYIILNDGPAVVISEIDYRGNTNSYTISKNVSQIYFNQPEGKLYVLSQNVLSASDKITQ